MICYDEAKQRCDYYLDSDICATGASKTRIVYQANLNFRTINPYLDLMIKNGLIKVKKERTLIYERLLEVRLC